MNNDSSELFQLIGRLHPLLVHLPIGFIVLLASLESLALMSRFRNASLANRTILVLSVPAVICSAACGWVLSWSGGYEEPTLSWHKWLGTGLVPAVIVLLALHWRGLTQAYRVCLAGTALLLAVTGHFGGTLTHGSGYLSLFNKASAANVLPSVHPSESTTIGSSSQPVFAAMIQPVFNEYCVTCHGPEKSKAKLRLDTAENVFKGSDSGPVVEPGDSGRSLMMKRLQLPEESDDHMPPSGKKQPSAHDIALLKWWINVGAPVSKTVDDLRMPGGE